MRLDGDDLSSVCTHRRGLVDGRDWRSRVARGRRAGGRPGFTGRRPCCAMARARFGSSAYASLRGSDTLLGVRSAALGRCVARRRRPRRRCRQQQESVLKQRCVRARAALVFCGLTQMSTAQVNERIRAASACLREATPAADTASGGTTVVVRYVLIHRYYRGGVYNCT